jgi:hypothetical protein
MEPATHVSAAEAAKTADATRKCGATGRRHSDQYRRSDSENFAVHLSFHDVLLFVCSLQARWDCSSINPISNSA